MGSQKEQEVLKVKIMLRMSSVASVITDKPHNPIFGHFFFRKSVWVIQGNMAV
jgi:hypothetical protein